MIVSMTNSERHCNWFAEDPAWFCFFLYSYCFLRLAVFLVVFRDDDLVAELCAMTSSAEDVTDEEAAYGVCRSIVISLSSELVIIDAFFCS